MYAQNGETKTINVGSPAGGQAHVVKVSRHTTLREMLQGMGLVPTDFDVAHPSGERLLSLDEKPYDIVTSPSDSIQLVPSAQVG